MENSILGVCNNTKCRTTEDNAVAETGGKEVWDELENGFHFEIIALNLSNNPCEAWAWSSLIFHIKKLALRNIAYLGFHNSSVTRWNLNSGPSWCSFHYITLPSSERESFTLHEPKGQKEVEVIEAERVSEEGVLPRSLCAVQQWSS